MDMFKNELIKGIKIGQSENMEALTGCTVAVCEEGAVCGVDVRGASPGTRETDLLDPVNTVQKVNAVVLSGGSAFGLESTCGVARCLEEKGVGFDVAVAKVPIVTGAILFDLAAGRADIRPDMEMGYEACEKALLGEELKFGNYGAGCGATVGKILGMHRAMKSGIGCCKFELTGGLEVAAIIAVNALGDVFENGEVLAGVRTEDGEHRMNAKNIAKAGIKVHGFDIGNTTIGIVMTNAKLDKAQCKKISQMAHDGMARAIYPIHTPHDGDTIFTMATGEVECDSDLTILGTLAGDAIEQAIINAVKNAETAGIFKSFKDMK